MGYKFLNKGQRQKAAQTERLPVMRQPLSRVALIQTIDYTQLIIFACEYVS